MKPGAGLPATELAVSVEGDTAVGASMFTHWRCDVHLDLAGFSPLFGARQHRQKHACQLSPMMLITVSS